MEISTFTLDSFYLVMLILVFHFQSDHLNLRSLTPPTAGRPQRNSCRIEVSTSIVNYSCSVWCFSFSHTISTNKSFYFVIYLYLNELGYSETHHILYYNIIEALSNCYQAKASSTVMLSFNISLFSVTSSVGTSDNWCVSTSFMIVV